MSGGISLVKVADIVVTETTLRALAAISKYRYLSVNQVAIMADLRPKSASEMLLRLERQKLLGSFGNTGIRGHGKTPKMYFLTKGGHGILSEEGEALGWDVEPYRQVSVTSRWSPQMFHRLDTLNALVALERGCRELQDYRLVNTLIEYRREKRGREWRAETTDYVADPPISENKIVPDAGFVLENTTTGNRALFLIEVDCGTERLTTGKVDAISQSFVHKLRQYDRYLESGRCRDRYKHLGTFSSFRMLVVTTSQKRIENMRQAAVVLDADFDGFYRFSTLNEVTENFLHSGWRSRDCGDHNLYQLIRGT
ncbi:MAG: replication-relaxation family protein [Bacteroidota bacterium]